MSAGREFHFCGAATENARRASSVRTLGTVSSGASDDRIYVEFTRTGCFFLNHGQFLKLTSFGCMALLSAGLNPIYHHDPSASTVPAVYLYCRPTPLSAVFPRCSRSFTFYRVHPHPVLSTLVSSLPQPPPLCRRHSTLSLFYPPDLI